MKMLSLLVTCVLIQDVTQQAQGFSHIIRAISDVTVDAAGASPRHEGTPPPRQPTWRHRHGHGQGGRRRARRHGHARRMHEAAGSGRRSIAQSTTTPTPTPTPTLDLDPSLLSFRVRLGAVKPALPPWELMVDADSSPVSDSNILSRPQAAAPQVQPEVATEAEAVTSIPEAKNYSSLKSGVNSTLANTLVESILRVESGAASTKTASLTSTTNSSKRLTLSSSLNSAMDEKAAPSPPSSESTSVEGHRLLRRRRDVIDSYVQVPVCRSVSEWVERRQAQDIWGNTVEILQEIEVGRTRVNQYFYETYCQQDEVACIGIDTSRFYSSCRNKHIWAYAKIRSMSGEEGWNLVKIRGSCNCGLYRRNNEGVDVFGLNWKRP